MRTKEKSATVKISNLSESELISEDLSVAPSLRESFVDDIYRWWLGLLLPYHQRKILRKINADAINVSDEKKIAY